MWGNLVSPCAYPGGPHVWRSWLRRISARPRLLLLGLVAAGGLPGQAGQYVFFRLMARNSPLDVDSQQLRRDPLMFPPNKKVVSFGLWLPLNQPQRGCPQQRPATHLIQEGLSFALCPPDVTRMRSLGQLHVSHASAIFIRRPSYGIWLQKAEAPSPLAWHLTEDPLRNMISSRYPLTMLEEGQTLRGSKQTLHHQIPGPWEWHLHVRWSQSLDPSDNWQCDFVGPLVFHLNPH